MPVERRTHPPAGAGAASDLAAFSLLELILVVAIMLVLVTLMFNTGPSRRERQLRACADNLQKIYLALQIYANDHGGKFPVEAAARSSEQALAVLVPHYTSDTSFFVCPASDDKPQPKGEAFRDWKMSYAYYMGRQSADTRAGLVSDAQVNTLSKAMGEPIFSSTGRAPGNNHGSAGGNVLLGDGSVQFSPPLAAFSLVLTQSVVLLNP